MVVKYISVILLFLFSTITTAQIKFVYTRLGANFTNPRIKSSTEYISRNDFNFFLGLETEILVTKKLSMYPGLHFNADNYTLYNSKDNNIKYIHLSSIILPLQVSYKPFNKYKYFGLIGGFAGQLNLKGNEKNSNPYNYSKISFNNHVNSQYSRYLLNTRLGAIYSLQYMNFYLLYNTSIGPISKNQGFTLIDRKIIVGVSFVPIWINKN